MSFTPGVPTPLLTIGMPVWNSVTTLAASIESHLDQDFTDFELVVSDNASDDGTAELADKYAELDPRVRVVRQEVNRGGSANFNAVVGYARGELFKWASGDDLVAPGHLSRCVAALQARPDVVLAYPKARLIDAEDRPLRDHEDGLHLPQDEPWLRLRDFAANRWLCNAMFGVVRTAVLRDTTLLTTSVSSDVTVLAQLALRGKVVEIPERLFLRRVQESSVGLGTLDRRTLAQWFDPGARPSLVPAKARVVWDINRAVLAAPLTPSEKARTLLAHDVATVRRSAVLLAEVIRMRRRGVRPSSWIDMRERMLADRYPLSTTEVG